MDKISALFTELEMSLEAKQKLDIRTGFMESVVVYTDNEKYDIDVVTTPPTVMRGPDSPASSKVHTSKLEKSDDILPKTE